MTADKAALLELRARLKAATGPDRELDDALWAMQTGLPSYTEGEPFKAGNPPRRTRLSIPRYTGSLDAAVGLLPDFVSYELTYSAAGDGAMRRVRLWDWRRSPPALDIGNRWEAEAATLPLAICAARIEYEIAKVTDHA